MANSLVPFEVPTEILRQLLQVLPDPSSNDDLSEGVQPSFAVVTFRGKVWRVRYKGDDIIIKGGDGEPVSSIVAVIVKASPAISKIFYIKSYADGDDHPPDCYSLDGVRPEPNVPNKQCDTCAACPNNVWGSRVTDTGAKAKACSDNRRLAVVPYPDVRNEAFGGPMLLRVPPTSLQELVRFADQLKQAQVPYQAIVVKISFDFELAYPRLVFTPVRALNVNEANTIAEYIKSEQLHRMLMEPVQGDETNPAANGAAEPASPQVPAVVAQPQPAPPKPQAAPAPQAQPAAQPAAPARKPEPELASMVMPTLEPEPEEKPKPSAAKAATAEISTVSNDLNDMIKSLIN